MYDTVALALDALDVGRSDFIDVMEEAVGMGFICSFKDGEFQFARGEVGCFRIVVKKFSIYLEGSLSRFHFGRNIGVLARGDVDRALDALGGALFGLDLREACVRRIDVAVNLIVGRDCSEYMRVFNGVKGAVRVRESDASIRFDYTRKRMGRLEVKGALAIYDKIKEVKRRGEVIDSVFEGLNVLRMERRFLKDIGGQLKRRDLRARDLYDVDFYCYLLQRVKCDFQSIERERALELPEGGGLKGLRDAVFARFALSEQFANLFGCDYSAYLSKAVCEGVIKRYDKSKELKRVRNCYKERKDEEGDAMAEEVDMQIERAFASFR